MATPPPPDQPAAAELSRPEVTITIGDGKGQVSAGQMVRYEVVVHNASAVEAPMTIVLTVPAYAVTGLVALDAAVVANAVAWKNVVAAGQTRSYSLTGRVDRAALATSLDVTACVHDRPNAPAVACATDRNELVAAQQDGSGARRMAWLGAIVFGMLAAVGAIWLYRKVNPELLTPASDDHPARPTRPGGAPSE
jgi:hypothetical protein